MRTWARLAGGMVFVIIVLPVMSGCTSGYKVNGKLLKNGQPLTVSEKGVIQMSLANAEEKAGGQPYPVDVNQKDGTFVVRPRGDGTTPTKGKYRIAVQVFDPYPGKDQLGEKFAPGKSPIVRDISGNAELTIDVAKADGGP